MAKSATPKTPTTESFKMPSIGGIFLPELALLGAGGYVLWKNRSKIQALMEKNGIEVPTIVSGDFSESLRTGAKALGAQDQETGNKKSDRTSTPRGGKLDG